jgi:predicted dehydrogenase
VYDSVGVAVVGTGFMGPVHVEALRRLGINVIGILGSSEAKSKAAANELCLAKAYASYEEALSDAEVTSVHIGAPNTLHFDMASRALKAGKHVLCEKPLAMNSRESAELLKMAEDSGLEAGVNYNIRYYPLNLHARSLIQNRKIGAVHSVCGGYTQDWLLYASDYNWRILAEKGGPMRAVSDIGTHWIDLVTFVTGLVPTAVFADLSTLHEVRQRPKGEVDTFSGKQLSPDQYEDVPVKTEDIGAVLFRFKNGGRGSMWVSQVTAGRKNCLRYEIAGADETLYWDSESPNGLWVGSRGGVNSLSLKDPGLIDSSASAFADYPGGHNEGYPDSFKMCFRAFYNKVCGTECDVPYPTFAEGHEEIRICDAIFESHAKQSWIDL